MKHEKNRTIIALLHKTFRSMKHSIVSSLQRTRAALHMKFQVHKIPMDFFVFYADF